MQTTTRDTFLEDESLFLFEQAQRDLETRRSDAPAASNGGYSNEIDEAKERLLRLRQQQDELERQQREIEVLKEKQDRFTTTRRQLGEQLQRMLTGLDREIQDLEEAGEVMENARQMLARDLQRVRSIDTEQWQAADLHRELDGALSTLDDASDHLDKVERRLSVVWNVIGPQDPGGAFGPRSGGSSWDCLRRGFFYSLPVMTFAAVLYSLFRIDSL